MVTRPIIEITSATTDDLSVPGAVWEALLLLPPRLGEEQSDSERAACLFSGRTELPCALFW